MNCIIGINTDIRRAGIIALKRWEPTKNMEKFFEDMFEEGLPARLFRRFPMPKAAESKAKEIKVDIK